MHLPACSESYTEPSTDVSEQQASAAPSSERKRKGILHQVVEAMAACVRRRRLTSTPACHMRGISMMTWQLKGPSFHDWNCLIVRQVPNKHWTCIDGSRVKSLGLKKQVDPQHKAKPPNYDKSLPVPCLPHPHVHMQHWTGDRTGHVCLPASACQHLPLSVQCTHSSMHEGAADLVGAKDVEDHHEVGHGNWPHRSQGWC